MKKIALISVVLTFVLMTIACQSMAPKHPTLNKDWSDMTITAEGEGAPPDDAINNAQAKLLACRSAKMDAYRNLTEKIYGVQVRGDSCIRDFIARDDRIRSSVQGFIKKAQVDYEPVGPGGACKVKVTLFLGKEFADIIMQ